MHVASFRRVTFWFLILPFMEQATLYEPMNSLTNGLGTTIEPEGSDLGSTTPVFSSRLPGADAAAREEYVRSLGRITTYFCPTRRPADGTFTNSALPSDNNDCNATEFSQYRWGPPSDYAIASIYRSDNPGNNLLNENCDQVAATFGQGSDPGFSNTLNRDFGPFRAALQKEWLTDGDDKLKNWKVRDSFAWWQDGSSNQIVAGEKYMYFHEVYSHKNDATWLFSHQNITGGTVRGFHRSWFMLARSQMYENLTQCNNTHKRFGSWHPGICNFLIGDGGVRAVSCNVSTENVLAPLIFVSDGQSVSLP